MRNLRLLALLAPVLLLPIACEDSSAPPGATFNPEAGPGFEAGITPPTEAGVPVDGGVDAFVPPATGVTVTVLDQGVPKAAVRVIVHDATGAVTGEMTTDATGKVSFVGAPSMVTVLTVSPYAEEPAPITFLGVAIGDNLVVSYPVQRTSTAAAGSYVAPLTAGTFTTGATDFYAYLGGDECADFRESIGSINILAKPWCLGAQNAILVSAVDNSDGFLGVTGFGFVKNLAKPAGQVTVNVPAITFAAPGSIKITASNLPNGAGTLNDAELMAIANGAGFRAQNGSGDITESGITFPTATGFADAYQTYVYNRGYTPLSEGSSRWIIRREASPAAATATLPTVDFSTALPLITGATVTAAVAARPDFTITPAASLATTDGGIVTMTWMREVNENQVYGSWTFVVPPTTTTFKAPALPANAIDFILQGGTEVSISDVSFIEATQLPGYKEVKALPIAPGSGVNIIAPSTPLPAAGTLRVTQFGRSTRT